MIAAAIKFLGWRGIALVGCVLALGVQSGRLAFAKHDLRNARAALVNPVTHKTWQSEAEAAVRDLGTCRANTRALESALGAQNSAVEALKAAGDRKAAVLATALRGARSEAAAATSRADRILKLKPKGADVCARLLEVDRAITGAGR